ncbi:Txe/YoeB family addiction module toxin [Caenimonas koreensis]|uniref:Putative mRNA interferase YoeB n=1 Tax=Caenimonas koreensis DSM 17982 TaxID=1121255 RepID=A0A844B7S7_9BURK|nr:Txe/YoeB family addiction module toxin [Caenimonas koreensis]MRD49212.1 Txe/YoeB family addiction module toxin [Caenimonas koreensis DSM 17982]
MAANLSFTQSAWSDYVWWQSQDRKTLKRINTLIESALRTPFEGLGKPEPLVGDLSGFWSRRIDEKNRLVYAVDGKDALKVLTVISCRFHYGDK